MLFLHIFNILQSQMEVCYSHVHTMNNQDPLHNVACRLQNEINFAFLPPMLGFTTMLHVLQMIFSAYGFSFFFSLYFVANITMESDVRSIKRHWASLLVFLMLPKIEFHDLKSHLLIVELSFHKMLFIISAEFITTLSIAKNQIQPPLHKFGAHSGFFHSSPFSFTFLLHPTKTATACT